MNATQRPSQTRHVPPSTRPSTQLGRHDWAVLGLLCAAQFMVVLDFSIVNVALPTIQQAFGLSEERLQWLVSFYALTFGGLLLLGGRAADLYGRRRMFVAGLLVFSAASLLGGLAPNAFLLVAARALQGAGAALLSPAALSLITTNFPEGPLRNRALGAYGAVGASGFAIGVFLGGLLTQGPGWRWVFFVNLPVGLVAALLAFPLLRESRDSQLARRLDFPGALTVTAGLALVVYTLSEATSWGWGSLTTWLMLAFAVALLGAFVVIEARSTAPLMPLGIFRHRNLVIGDVVGMTATAAAASQVFVITLYLQGVEGYSPLQTGLAFLVQGLAAMLGAILGSRGATRLGLRTVLVVGRLTSGVALLLMLRISERGGALPGLLLPLLLMGVGNVMSMVSASIAATNGVEPQNQGLASGLLNTAQQVGAALGLSILVSIAMARTGALVNAGVPQPTALVDGFRYALAGGAVICAIGALVGSLATPRRIQAATTFPERHSVSTKAA